MGQWSKEWHTGSINFDHETFLKLHILSEVCHILSFMMCDTHFLEYGSFITLHNVSTL